MPALGELRQRVFHATSGLYTETYHMDNLLNDALNQLVEIAKLRGVQTLSLIPGTDTYALTDNFKSPGQLLDTTDQNCAIPYELVDITENRFGYTIENGNIIIKPVPQQSKELTHYYYKYATQLVNDSDVPEIDSQYHDLLSTYASGMILLLPTLQIQDKTLSDRYLVRWQEGKLNFANDMQRKNKATRGRTVNLW